MLCNFFFWGGGCRQLHYRELLSKFNFMLYTGIHDIKCVLGATSTPAVSITDIIRENNTCPSSVLGDVTFCGTTSSTVYLYALNS